MTVADIMREDVVTAPPDEPMHRVATRMREERVGCVVVLEDDAPVGIVTDRDVAVRLAADQLDPAAMTANDTMTEDPVTVEADSGVFDLCQLLGDEAVRRAPVVEDDELVGIVTLDDLTVLLTGEMGTLAGVIQAESPPYQSPQ